MDKTYEVIQLALIPTTRSIVDGIDTETEGTPTTVWARHGKATRSEHYAAEQNGHKVEDVYVIYSWEYNNEPIVSVGTDKYRVVRTYQRTADFVELMCERLTT